MTPERPARPLILAHRGDWTSAPENSLAAFVAAVSRDGIDGVEFDVRAASDGTPVVIHDADLERVQGIQGLVNELSVERLASLGVPDLAAVLAVLPDAFFLDVELKEDVGSRVVPLLSQARGEPPRNVVLSSFQAGSLLNVRALVPDWPCWLIDTRLDEDVVETALATGCRGLAIAWPALEPRSVKLVQEAGLELATWTVYETPTLNRIAQLDLVAICVDPPAFPAARGRLE